MVDYQNYIMIIGGKILLI